MSDGLDRVVAAKRAHDDTARQLQEAVVEAKAAGNKISAIANAAEVTRQTVYRWLQGQGAPASRRISVRHALDDALIALIPAINPATAAQVQRRVGGEVDVQLLGLKMALANLRPGITQQFTTHQRGALAVAAEVEVAAKRWHDKTGEWPEAVQLDGLA